MHHRLLLPALLLFAPLAPLGAANNIVVADFEAETFGNWSVAGTAFGAGPVNGSVSRQQGVTEFHGKGLANSFHGGDAATGKLTSPGFKIERPWINFLIGGGAFQGQTCMNLVIDGKVVRTATGPNSDPGGTEALVQEAWNVADLSGKTAYIEIVDQSTGGWGHVSVDQIVQSDTRAANTRVLMEKSVVVNGTHLLIPVGNDPKAGTAMIMGIYEGATLIQNFSLILPFDGTPSWVAAYPLEHFGVKGKTIRITPMNKAMGSASVLAAFERIKVGSASEALADTDYSQPYRNQFHASTRRGWINDPNGMVYSNGKYHLYYQHNPLGINWGNMHWGHLESTDLIHWEEKPIALYQRTVGDMAYSGNGFIDVNNTAGLGKDTQFAAYTSTGRGECLAYSKDGGLTFTDIPENPVVKHKGRDPFVIWYEPEQKWVMAVYSEDACEETAAVPAIDVKKKDYNIGFYESKNLRQWTRTGAFTDADRMALYECPQFFSLPVQGKPGESRWILLGAHNRYFIGQFDGKKFIKESGPYGTQHGSFYAAQSFSNVPDGRRIQMGWVWSDSLLKQFPDQILGQGFTLPHEMTLRETPSGLRMFFSPVKETEKLRAEIIAEGTNLTTEKADALLQACKGELAEVLIEFTESGHQSLIINGIDANFKGKSARIFSDRTVTELYVDDGLLYDVRKRPEARFEANLTQLKAGEGVTVRSLKIFRLNSIWRNSPTQK